MINKQIQLLETIRVENGRTQSLEYHQKRVNHSCQQNDMASFNIASYLDNIILPASGLWKLSIIYSNDQIDHQIIPYRRRKIQSLKLVDGGQIDYKYKWADRNALNQLFAQRGSADDIIIVKNGLITDTSYSNLVFTHGNGEWHTPKTPLLKGTQRANLLDKGLILEIDISPEMLDNYKDVMLINALNALGEMPTISVGMIG